MSVPRLQILHVPGCPSVPVLIERLRDEALAGIAAELETVVVNDLADAERWGMCGSPTLLVDGADPFADPDSRPSLSCRLYADADGTRSGAPSAAALRAVVFPR